MGGQTKKEWPWPLPFPEASCGDVGLLAALLGGAHAPGTDMNAHQLAADQEALSLHIGTKVTVGPPLRVADIMSETLRLSANVTLASHDWLHFCVQNELAIRPRQTRNRTLEGVRKHTVYTRTTAVDRSRVTA